MTGKWDKHASEKQQQASEAALTVVRAAFVSLGWNMTPVHTLEADNEALHALTQATERYLRARDAGEQGHLADLRRALSVRRKWYVINPPPNYRSTNQ